MFSQILRIILVVYLCLGVGQVWAQKKVILVYHPDALTPIILKVEKSYESSHPGVDVQLKAVDSWQALHASPRPDVIISADAYFLKRFWGERLEDLTVFARDTVVIAAADPLRAEVLGPGTWVETLASEHTVWGMPDPKTSALGYQGLMCLTLWSMEHGFKGLYLVKDLLEKDLGIKVTCCKATGWELKLPEHLVPKTGRIHLEPASRLVSDLKAGTLHYIFLYQSQAQREHLRFYRPPSTQNLGALVLAARYEQVKLIFPHGVIQGEPVYYGIAVVKGSPNYAQARGFFDFFLSRKGRALLSEGALPLIAPFKP